MIELEFEGRFDSLFTFFAFCYFVFIKFRCVSGGWFCLICVCVF